MEKQIKTIIEKTIEIIFVLAIICGVKVYDNNILNNTKESYETKLAVSTVNAQISYRNELIYKTMYDSTSKQLDECKYERDEAVNKYNYIQEQIKYSKINDTVVANRGNYGEHKLTSYPIITVDEMNTYIKNIVPENSPFIGRGKEFLEAGSILKMDPRYIFAHSCVESSYGTSKLALEKGNYFGINAQNENPNLAFHLGNSMEDGILNGAEWIKENYINKGNDTLEKMLEAGYAQYDNGSPNTKWLEQISNIASRCK